MKPRTLHNLLTGLSTALLLLAGTGAHLWATSRRLARLRARVEALEQAPPREGWGESSPQLEPELEQSAVEDGPSMQAPLERPRILGIGRCAGRVYWDVRYPDGEVLRYYARTNSTPAETRWLVDAMIQDARSHREPLPSSLWPD